MTKEGNELLPCPFCGGEAEIERKGTARQSMIYVCTNCGARRECGDVFGLTKPEHYGWNDRPTPPTPAGAGTETTTPRTDVNTLKQTSIFLLNKASQDGLINFVPVDFARQLERELTSLRRQAEADRATIAKMAADINGVVEECGKHISLSNDFPWSEEVFCALQSLVRERDELRAQLASADKDRERKPRRRLQLSLNLGADNRDELLRALDQIVLEMQMGHLWGDSCSGGCGSGYYMDVNEDESITHESYFAAIAAMKPCASIDHGATGENVS